MTQKNRPAPSRIEAPTLARASQDRVDATKAPSILAALEQTASGKPVFYADRSRGARRLPWHWPLLALGLVGAALWGYASWSGRVVAVDRSPAALTLPRASSLPAATPPATSSAQAARVLVPPNGTVTEALNADARSDTKAAHGADAGKPATLVDMPAAAGGAPSASAPVAVALANKTARAKTPVSKTAAAKAAPATATTKARATTVGRAATDAPSSPARPIASRSIEDDPDVAVVSALIDPARERMASAPAPATQRPTIASLVRQCNALKPRDASACRRRICDGYWGKAQACPAATAERKTTNL